MSEPRRTEARNEKARGLEAFTTRQIVELMNDEDATVPGAVRATLPAIEKAVEAIVGAIKNGGHVLYVGAGTSGRLGVLDASEAPPTFGVDPDLFFPERGASTREAKEVCRGCVVREECLEYALTNGEKFGIWGGMSERERRRIRRARALARRRGEIATA